MGILIYSGSITLFSHMRSEPHGRPTCEAHSSYERGSTASRFFNNFPFFTRGFVDFMPYDYYGHNGPIMRAIAVFIMGE